MVNTISQILKITKEEDLLSEFQSFESSLHNQLIDLQTKLAQSVTTTEIGTIQNHMAFVESWRDRATKYNALAAAFVEHCKSTYFLMAPGVGIKVMEREAHQKKLLAGFVGIKTYTEELIRNIDSRVNICKILLRVEVGGSTPATFR